MKTIKFSLSVIAGLLITLSFCITSNQVCGQNKTSQNQDKQVKKESIRKIQEIMNESEYHGISMKKVLKVAKKAELNFGTYVHIADLVHEFGYHTDPLIKIARYASDAKVESDYYTQLSDLVVMKLSETQAIVDLAQKASKLDSPANKEIDKKIQEIRRTSDFKTMDEAKAYNKAEIDRLLNRRYYHRS